MIKPPPHCSKPHLKRTTRFDYAWVCEGGGSFGYADTPAKAYRRWVANYQRRIRRATHAPVGARAPLHRLADKIRRIY